ncbi:SPASM domain-containing protein (plasmid) [Roseibium aggregatum]|uniref:radical SAM/SPASM domain-containing protein n=1 Tax=Roseibium aggregatum TaxID=187304 RepID=UPI001E2C10A4|nr:SPASM domain-containing protein [Roseibium aggregatum]UES60274.1 SPASM domain-containing protein [Roseibium aggregatum]
MSKTDVVHLGNARFNIKTGTLYLGSDIDVPDIPNNSITAHRYREPTPQLQISMTDACNLNCSYCSFRDRVHSDGKPVNMPDATAKRAIEFFSQNIPTHYTSARIDFGLAGEPLLRQSKHEDLISAVEAEFMTGNFEAVWTGTNTTNATLLKDDPELSLFGPPMDISIDGPKEVHDRHRRYVNGSGSFDDVAAIAKKALAKYPTTSCSTVLTADCPDFLGIFRFLTEEIGFSDVYMKPVNSDRTVSYGLNQVTLEVFKAGYTELIEYIMTLDDTSKLAALLKFNSDDYFMRFFRRLKHGAKEIYRCGAGKSGLFVDTNGRLYPCAHFIGKTGWHIGTLDDGLYNDKTKEYFSLTVDSREPCKSCWARYLCGGGCYYQAVLANGRLDEPDEVKCDLIRHLCTLAAKLLENLSLDSPQVFHALPASFCLPDDYLEAQPEDIYRPKSLAVSATEGMTVSHEIEKIRSVEGRLFNPAKSLNVFFHADSQELSFTFTHQKFAIDSIEIDIFDLDSKPFRFHHLKSPRASYQPRQIKIVPTENEWSVFLVSSSETGVVRRIPYANPLLETIVGAHVSTASNKIKVSIPKSMLFMNGAKTIGLGIRALSEGGVNFLVRYEPYFELASEVLGPFVVQSPEFRESKNSSDILNKCPVDNFHFLDAWGAIRNNVC